MSPININISPQYSYSKYKQLRVIVKYEILFCGQNEESNYVTYKCLIIHYIVHSCISIFIWTTQFFRLSCKRMNVIGQWKVVENDPKKIYSEARNLSHNKTVST